MSFKTKAHERLQILYLVPGSVKTAAEATITTVHVSIEPISDSAHQSTTDNTLSANKSLFPNQKLKTKDRPKTDKNKTKMVYCALQN